jgi:hypothetical protein
MLHVPRLLLLRNAGDPVGTHLEHSGSCPIVDCARDALLAIGHGPPQAIWKLPDQWLICDTLFYFVRQFPIFDFNVVLDGLCRRLRVVEDVHQQRDGMLTIGSDIACADPSQVNPAYRIFVS